jgi:hypothetical protein
VSPALIVAGLYFIGVTWWRRFATEVAVTDRREICAIGFINPSHCRSEHGQDRRCRGRAPIVGRLLNYGDIIIHGTGDGEEGLQEIDHPLNFRSLITAA